jgi:hypothetical protein
MLKRRTKEAECAKQCPEDDTRLTPGGEHRNEQPENGSNCARFQTLHVREEAQEDDDAPWHFI